MFEAGVSLFPIRCDKPTVNKVVNRIEDTRLVLWWKHYPHDPRRYVCEKTIDTPIVVPAIQETKELLGTHLECRVMRSDCDCWCRVLLWLEEDKWICAASPNDTDRNIDNMSFDLSTCKRKLPATRTMSLTFHKKLDHIFLDIGQHTIPIEYLY